MPESLLAYSCLILFGTFISAVAQVLLKKSAQVEHESRIKEYLNFKVIFAYSLFLASTLLCIFAYRVVPLSFGPVLESTSYLYVTLFGYLFFRERVTKKKLLALALILGGIVVYSFGA